MSQPFSDHTIEFGREKCKMETERRDSGDITRFTASTVSVSVAAPMLDKNKGTMRFENEQGPCKDQWSAEQRQEMK